VLFRSVEAPAAQPLPSPVVQRLRGPATPDTPAPAGQPPSAPSASGPPATLPVQRATLPALISAPPLDLPVRQVPSVPPPDTGHASVEPVTQPEPVVTDTLGADTPAPPDPAPTVDSTPVQRVVTGPPVPPRRLGLGAPLSVPEPVRPPTPASPPTPALPPTPEPPVQRAVAESPVTIPDLGEFAVPEHPEPSMIFTSLLGDQPLPIRQRSEAAPHVESPSRAAPVPTAQRTTAQRTTAQRTTAPHATRPGTAATPVMPSTPVAPTVARLMAAHQQAHEQAHQPLSVAAPQLVPAQETPVQRATPEPAPAAEPVVQTVTVQRVETTAPAPPEAPATPPTEDLVAKLYDPLLRRLRTELRVERDRRGNLTDLRH